MNKFIFVGDPDVDLQFHGGIPSFFTRAYHTRPSQGTTTSDLEQHTVAARTLPQHHPLLVRHADHPQQLTSRAVGGPSIHTDPTPAPVNQSLGAARGASGQGNVAAATVGGAGAVDPHHHESAMQQLLSNISAAAGTNEVLGFGVGSIGSTQRSRGGY